MPLNGKNAILKGFPDRKIASEQEISSWWRDGSTNNIGIITGGGLVVLDVDHDPDKGAFGYEDLAELESENGELPMTWVAKSGGGGEHYYFHCTESAKLKNRARFYGALDIRTDGGYIVTPPSIHPDSGREYEWDADRNPGNTELAELPGWLYELLPKHEEQTERKNRPSGNSKTATFKEGSRNQELCSLAGKMRRQGLTVDEIEAALQTINENRCNPPLERVEVSTIAASVGRYEPGASNSLKPADFSDSGNATVFAREYGRKAKYADALGWLYWNGKKWEEDEHKVLSLAMNYTERLLNQARSEEWTAATEAANANSIVKANPSDQQAKEAAETAQKKADSADSFLKFAQKSRDANRTRNLLELSKAFLSIPIADLDGNPAELNTPAGIVNLTNGEIRAHTPDAMCTKITSVSPGKTGEDMWEDFLNTITGEDGSLKGFLQLVAGMALHGKVYEERMVIAYGGGGNGKSTFFNALLEVLGDYAGLFNVETLISEKGNKGANIATLKGKRLILAGELDEGKRLMTGTLKRLTSTDKIVSEKKFKDPEEFTPSHTLVMFTNHLPRVESTDRGTWRRLLLCPFENVIQKNKNIPNFGSVLVKEAGPAILQWAIKGAINFARNGYQLVIPDVVEEETETYRERENWLENFIRECCTLGPDRKDGARELYNAYREWATGQNEYIRREREFSAAMTDYGFAFTKPNGKKIWKGVEATKSQFYRVAG